MTENSFAAVCNWLQSQHLKRNSIYIVFQNGTEHVAWKFAGTIGTDKIKLERSQGHGNPYLKREIDRNEFKTVEMFMNSIQISLSKESILNSYKESKA